LAESKPEILAVTFDCFGTIVDFGDEHFARAYGEICAEQGIEIDGQVFYDKWMEIWRRLAADGRTSDTGTVAITPGAAPAVAAAPNRPAALSQAEEVPPHPAHHTPSAGRSRSMDGPVPPFRPYSEEWPEHFALCFEEFGVKGDAQRAYERLREMLGLAKAFPEALGVVESLSRRLPVAMMSNSDDDFLLPALAGNGFSFPIVISSESAQAYKPHVAIFECVSKELSLPRENILYVGDSRFADVAGAKNAGLHAAWVNRRGRRPLEAAGGEGGENRPQGNRPQRELPQPDYEIDNLEKLLGILA
jgi:2-haloalkanoic acid dehalogenase type II